MTQILPSFALVPGKYNQGSLFPQIPMDTSADLTVTRATTATRVNASGLIESVASGIPRLDYFTSGGVTGCPALLVEPAATNICLQSEDFSTTWVAGQQGTGVNAAITTNAAIAPDGNTTADLIVFYRGAGNTSNDRSTLTQQPTVVSGTVYTQSVYLKAATSGDVGKQIGIRNVAQSAALVITLTANWVRYSKTETAPSNSGFWQFINIGGITADNTVSVHAWGAQLETGSVATSYIPTTTGTVSRAADVISVSGAVSGSIGQTEGAAYIEVDFTQGFTRGAYILTLRSSNTVYAALAIRANGRLGFAVTQTTPLVDLGNVAAGQLSNAVFKIAFAYKSGDYALYMNGNQVATSGSTGVPTSLNEIRFSAEGTLGNDPLQGKVRAVALYTTRLTNETLAFMTSPYTTYQQMASQLNYTSL